MDKTPLFAELNDNLANENVTLEIICAGGFVLEYYNLRGTQDVDAFYTENEKIRNIIQQVGEKYNANEPDELWLNNSVANMNRIPPRKICTPVFQFSHLTVLMPPLDYILGMKLESGRERDKHDSAEIIRRLKLTSVKQAQDTLHSYGFHTDLSLLLESFEEAYGMNWLADYMAQHMNELDEL